MEDVVRRMFDDQKAFNELIWKSEDRTPTELIERYRSLALGMNEEMIEFLRTFEYKSHRRYKGKLPNVAHSHEELIDLFKYWLSLAALSGFPIDRLEELYQAKSQVVRYRHQEEWMKEVKGPCVVVDIDEVLGDYRRGICDWVRSRGPHLLQWTPQEELDVFQRLARIEATGLWVDHASVGLPLWSWQQIKHDFRTRGGKRTIPVFPDARPFLDWCRSRGWMIILVTSRPIDRYPNLMSDTLFWLNANHLQFDTLWWSSNKTERLEEANIALRSQIIFAVDDSDHFVAQYRAKGVRSYRLDRYNELPFDAACVENLGQLMKMEDTWQTIKTRNTDHTPSTPAKNHATPSLTDPNPSTSNS